MQNLADFLTLDMQDPQYFWPDNCLLYQDTADIVRTLSTWPHEIVELLKTQPRQSIRQVADSIMTDGLFAK